LSIPDLFAISRLDSPILQFFDLLQLAYSLHYFLLSACLNFFVTAACLDFLKVFLPLFDLFNDRIEQFFELFIFLLLGLRACIEQIKGRLAIFLLIVLECTLRHGPVVSPFALLLTYFWEQGCLFLGCNMSIELLFVFELKAFLEIINHLFTVDPSLPGWQHGKSTVSLFLNLGLYLIHGFPLRYKVYRVIFPSGFLRQIGVVNDSFLWTLLFLLGWPHGLPARLSFHWRVIYLRFFWCRI
jgi:hypothetical protein